MKILELTNFSAGVDGVFTRVKQEALELEKKGHEVRIFSSNFTKGSSTLAPWEEKIGKNIIIQRLPAKKLGGESYMSWVTEKQLKKSFENFKPEVIIAHAYRHTHTVVAARVAKDLGIKAFLVTHAPFIHGDSTRSFLAKWYIRLFHDPFVGKSTLKRFNKIVAITKWEIPYLKKLGVPDNKIGYIPNGIPDEFFSQKQTSKEENKILFLGRISPIKNLQVVIQALALVKDKKIKFEIVGPEELDYLGELKQLIDGLKLKDRVIISKPIYNIKEKIKKIDSAKIFVLPSKREAMPQALIEAMSRSKLVLASDNPGSRDLINNKQNGFIFKNSNIEDCAKTIDEILSLNKKQANKIKNNSKSSVEQFAWSKIIKKIENLIKNG